MSCQRIGGRLDAGREPWSAIELKSHRIKLALVEDRKIRTCDKLVLSQNAVIQSSPDASVGRLEFTPYCTLSMPNGRKGAPMAAEQTHIRSPRATGSWVFAGDHRQPHLSDDLKERYSSLIDANGLHLVITLELLGGHKVFTQAPRNMLEVHYWVSHGIPSASISHLAHAIDPLSSHTLS